MSPTLRVTHRTGPHASHRQAALRELVARLPLPSGCTCAFVRNERAETTKLAPEHAGAAIELPDHALWRDDDAWKGEAQQLLESLRRTDSVPAMAEALFERTDSGMRARHDLLSVCDGLLRGREERTSAKRDSHGRWPASESLLSRSELLDRPVVDEVAQAVGYALAQMAPDFDVPSAQTWSFALTFDIDSAGLSNSLNAARFCRRALNEQNPFTALRAAVRSAAVLCGGKSDPCLPLDAIADQLARHDAKASFFVQALRAHRLDDYTLAREWPLLRACRRLVARGHEIGLHSSYRSIEHEAIFMKRQRRVLQRLLGTHANIHRAHYLRHVGTESDRLLHSAGIRVDATQGFSAREGFRRGTARPVLPGTDPTPVSVPLHLMDVTLRYHRKMSADAAFECATDLLERVRRTGGCAVLLWHPHNMESILWKGWEDFPFRLLSHAMSNGARPVTVGQLAREEVARRRALFSSR